MKISPIKKKKSAQHALPQKMMPHIMFSLSNISIDIGCKNVAFVKMKYYYDV